MNEAVEREEVLVAVTIETAQGYIQLAVGGDFHDQIVLALEAWYTNHDKKSDTKSIKVIFEDESYIWIDLPQTAVVQRRYNHIAIDGPAQTK